MREWMRHVDRSLSRAQRAASSIAEAKVLDLATTVNADRERTPAAPIELTSQTYVDLDSSKNFKAGVIVDFPDVTIDNTGAALTIQSYELWGRKTPAPNTDADPWALMATNVASTIADFGYDPGSSWDFQVRAIGTDTIVPGDWSSIITVQMLVDSTPPGQPTTPTLTASHGTLTLRWDGQAVTGTMPLDLDYVVVAGGTTSSPTTEVYRFPPSPEGNVTVFTGLTYGQTNYYRLMAVDTTGNQSPWSAQVTGQTSPLVDADLEITQLDASALVDQSILSAKLANNAVTQAKLEQLIQDNIQKGVDASAGLVTTNQTISTLQTTVSGKNTITNSTASPGSNYGVAGDRWQKWSTLAIGGKLTASWRSTGAAWIPELIDPVYLPQVDIGAGTFGSLDGSRLTADSVSTSQLRVGSFDNLITEPDFSNGGVSWGGGTATPAFITGAGRLGGTVMRITGGAANANVYSLPGRITTEPGDSYRLAAWVNPSIAAVANAVRIVAKFYTETGGTVGYGVIANTTTFAAASWSRLLGTVVTPANTATVSFYMEITTAMNGGTMDTDFVSAIRAATGELIVDGTITGTKVAAGTLTGKQMVIGDFQNFALGSDFEDATAIPWGLSALHTTTTTQKHSGTTSLRLGSAATASTSTLTSDFTKVKSGEMYYVEFWIYIDASFNGTLSNSKLRISNQSDTLLASMPFDPVSVPTRSVWTKLSYQLTIPASTTNLQVKLVSDNTAGFAYFDDLVIRRMSEASLIQNLGVEQLTASGASINSAVISTLWTQVVRSQKISTDMLVVTGENYMWNGDGQNGDNSNWSAWTFDAADPAPGTFGAFTLSTQTTQYLANNQPVVKVEADTYYVLSGWIRASVTGSKTYIESMETGGTNPNPQYILNNYDVPTTWTKFSVPVKTSVGQTAMQFRMFANHSNGTVFNATQKVAGLHFRKQIGTDLVVAGGIKAVNIDVNDLGADTAWIGTLRGSILINDVVDTGQLKAGAITSKHTITGALFQTQTTANRGIKFSSTAINAWDASGTNTFSLDATTGNVTATGVFQTSPSGRRVKLWDHGDTIASMDLYPDTSLQHGALYSEYITSSSLYATELSHFTTASALAGRLTMMSSGTVTLQNNINASLLSLAAGGAVTLQGIGPQINPSVLLAPTAKPNSALLIGSLPESAQYSGQQMITGQTSQYQTATSKVTWTVTYAAPVPTGIRRVICCCDGIAWAAAWTMNATASGVTLCANTPGSNNTSVIYEAIWTE